MKNKLLFLTTIFVIVACENNPVVPENESDNISNPFIGKWAEVFDTTADERFSKEEKIDYWYGGDLSGWKTPDTFEINDDSIYNKYVRYWYDSLFFYTSDLNDNESIKNDTIITYYKIVGNDSLYFYSDLSAYNTIYIPLYIRIE